VTDYYEKVPTINFVGAFFIDQQLNKDIKILYKKTDKKVVAIKNSFYICNR